MLLNIDLHTHTARHSPCSNLTPDALCETAVARGLNALAITEHHYQWSPRELAPLQARHPEIQLYAGVEVSCTDGRDYVVLGLPPGLIDHGRMTYARLRALLDAHPGTFVFIAHCFRHSGREDGLAGLQVDGIEMGSYNLIAWPPPDSGPVPIVRAELYDKWQRRMGWVSLYNSDGHSKRMIGTFYSQIETLNGPPPDEAGLIALLRQAEVRGVQDDEVIRNGFHQSVI